MKFPGASFCDGKQKLMVIATLPLTIKKVFQYGYQTVDLAFFKYIVKGEKLKP